MPIIAWVKSIFCKRKRSTIAYKTQPPRGPMVLKYMITPSQRKNLANVCKRFNIILAKTSFGDLTISRAQIERLETLVREGKIRGVKIIDVIKFLSLHK